MLRFINFASVSLVFMEWPHVGKLVNLSLHYYYRQDLPEGQLCRYFVYSRADFGVFRPAGATRCTDQGQIWYGPLLIWSLPNLTSIGSGLGVYGPQN